LSQGLLPEKCQKLISDARIGAGAAHGPCQLVTVWLSYYARGILDPEQAPSSPAST